MKTKVILSLLLLLSTTTLRVSAADPPQRTWGEFLRGHRTAADAWNVYDEATVAMGRTLQYTKDQFFRLDSAERNRLASEAKQLSDQYETYRTAYYSLKLDPQGKDWFCSHNVEERKIIAANAKDAAENYPAYKSNMVRMSQPFKTGEQWVSMKWEDRASERKNSDGTERTALQALRGFYSAADGWKTYSESLQRWKQSLEYTEWEFIHLDANKIDDLANEAKKTAEILNVYIESINSLKLTPISADDFWKLDLRRREDQSANAKDAADKYPVYVENMQRMHRPFTGAKEWVMLSLTDRKAAFADSEGSRRSTVDLLKGRYSAKEGWEEYLAATQKLGVPRQYDEWAFVHLDISTIDNVATNAKRSADLYSEAFLHVSPPITPQKFYDMAVKDKEAAVTKYAAERAYAASCSAAGLSPNWRVFESKSEAERQEFALIASQMVSRYTTYKELCGKLDISPDPGFLRVSPEAQDQSLKKLKDALWEQRKEVITEVGTAIAMTAVAIIAERQMSSPDAEEEESANTPTASKIDREKFAKIRQQYWKDQLERNPDNYPDPADQERMKAGKAPVGNDGYPMELHHADGTPSGPIEPMTRTEHRGGDNYRTNHPWLFSGSKSGE